MSENLTLSAGETALHGQDYLDTKAKVSFLLDDNGLQQPKLKELLAKYLYHAGHVKKADSVSGCGHYWASFACFNGHKIYRKLSCGLPYCPTCGKPGSALNKKRANRVKDVLLGFDAIGHFVFTLPKEISERMPDPVQINSLYKLAWKILSEIFDAEAAVIALHFCGDEKSGLHLHFDCSFPVINTEGECQYPLGILNLARDRWTWGVNAMFDTIYLQMVGHYNFVNTREQELHLIKYITRSTITADKFIELPDTQKEYCVKMSKVKIIRYFGNFVGKKKDEFLKKYKVNVERATPGLIEQNICPICNEKMKHSLHPVFMDDINLSQFEWYDDRTLIDREIAATLRELEKKKTKMFTRDDFVDFEEFLTFKEWGFA